MSETNGMTEAEDKVHKGLMDAYENYLKLPQQHPDELRDFVNAIHILQGLVTIRIVRRLFPKGWPIIK